MDTITIVVPWFGRDTAGGAETQARQLARAIHEQGAPVEVWATTGRDSFLPPSVARRRVLLDALPAFPDHELRLLASLVSSDALLEAVASAGAGRRFLFIPYPFPTSFWGVLLAGERA